MFHVVQGRLRPNLAALGPMGPKARGAAAALGCKLDASRLGDEPGDAAYCDSRARVLACLSRLQRAQAAFSAALDINSQDGETYQRRGEQQLLLGDLDAAIADYRLAVRLQPRSAGLRPALWRQPAPSRFLPPRACNASIVPRVAHLCAQAR